MKLQSIGIVGLGAMGGSLAQALIARGARVVGYDTNARNVALARGSGVDAAMWERDGDVDCDAVVVATPIRAMPDVFRTLQPQADRFQFITDLGSVKRVVLRAAEANGLGRIFVGSHPLTGTHETGWSASRPDAFTDAVVFLCASAQADPDVSRQVSEFWQEVGAKSRAMNAEEHDRLLARISHLPQLTSSALAVALQEMGVARKELGPGGTDMTRLAGSDADMWVDIAAANADMLDEPLSKMIDRLSELKADLRNKTALLELLRTSASWYRG
jgi:prephenate dehydrogenase